jgi:signal transduction histidine kinase
MTECAAAAILIVDDEIQNRKLLETLLRPQGYRLVSVSNGQEALESIAKEAPDLILLDVMMPGMDGYQLAGILKAASATSNIPIIMVTALIERDARRVGLGAGAEDFLAKPVDRLELSLKVRNLLRLKALGDHQVQAREETSYLNAMLEELVRQRTAQLQAANAELEAFSYSVAHDLRAPLGTIEGFSKVLGDEIGSGGASERVLHYLSRIRAGARQMGELIDAMLLLASVPRTDLHWETLDLSAMAQAVVDEHREREPGRAVQVEIEAGLVANGDARLVRQVLINLIGNAWKFSSRQPLARITFRRDGGSGGTVYAVRDNGVGFDMAYADKLFGAFQRLHNVSEFPGTGIGLATVRRIIRSHGGRVWAESTVGDGAAFYFVLGSVPE